MIFFDHEHREEFLPAYFKSPEFQRIQDIITQRMALPKKQREQSDLPPVWKQPFDSSVGLALAKLSHQRCAFCERVRQDLSPYRFRPPGYADPLRSPEGKDSYIWLAFTWSNLFPICGDCRPTNPNHFPVSGRRARVVLPAKGPRLDERAGLYFPGELATPSNAFDVGGNGELLPRGTKAADTLAHFNLNAAALVIERRASLVDFIGDLPRIALGIPDDWRKLFLEGPFGGSRYLYLRRLVTIIGRFKEVRAPTSLLPRTILDTIGKWRESMDLAANLQKAAETLSHEDSVKFLRDLKTHTPSSERGRDRAHPPIKSVKISTFKSLEALGFTLPEALPPATQTRLSTDSTAGIPEAPCLLILGENATGKSSVLKAVALGCLSPTQVAKLVTPDELALNPEYLGADPRQPLPDSEVIVAFHDETERRFASNARSGAAEPFQHSGDRDEEPLVFAYGAHRLFGKSRRSGDTRHFDTLFNDDRQLSNPEDWLRGLAEDNPAALDEVVSALRYIIQIDGKFESLEFRQSAPGDQKRCFIRVQKQRPDGSTFVVAQPLEIVSSGYRAILALVCDVLEGLFAAFTGDARAARLSRAIILIDEIEAHLHPRWKMHIIGGLRRALPRATFIITSHDPLCVRGMFNGEIMALNRYLNLAKDGLGLPERVESVEGFEQIESMTIDQLLTSDLFQLLSTDDREIELELAQVADILAKDPETLSPEEARLLDRFRTQIGQGLPFGRDEIPRLVQEAVAEFIRDRRIADADRVSASRTKAKKAVKAYLKDLLA